MILILIDQASDQVIGKNLTQVYYFQIMQMKVIISYLQLIYA